MSATTPGSDTATNTPSTVAAPSGPAPSLVLALECEQPHLPSRRYPLDGLAEVKLGRGTEHAEERSATALQLRIADGRMSSRHARLVRELGRWLVEDDGSKNGVLVNGVPQKRALLSHGDLLELGHTFLYFVEREGPPPPPAPPLIAPALATFVPRLEQTLSALAQVAASRVPVVLLGETGTGKEVTARSVHALSRRPGAFVPVNCGALPRTLIESELFGHRKGAFTGASEDRPGLVRAAAGGTLFLDEIGDLPLEVQAAFLRVLQEGEVSPIGAAQPVQVDVRFVAATHRDLDALVARGEFRGDLLARLSGLTVKLPPLRERREDLGLLIGAVLSKLDPARGITLSREAGRALLTYRWPLNVRELEQALSVAAVLAKHGRIELGHLPEALRTPVEPEPAIAEAPLSEEELARKQKLAGLVEAHRGNVTVIARELGVARMQVQRWLKRYGIDPRPFRQ